VIDALRQALAAAGLPGAGGPIEPLADTGLAHLHLRLVGTGRLARVPKQSQMGLAPGAHLAYEAACFRQAERSGHTPLLHAVLAPSPELPRGALLVDDVPGRPLRLPQDLPALVTALAHLHALPLAGDAGPLLTPQDPLAALAADIDEQALHLPAAGLQPAALACITHERTRLRQLLQRPARPPRHLIAFDAHPGNFILHADGRAVLVDLEKARHGAAALDLAHATLYTSTTWDRHSHAVLDDAQVLQAARQWLQALSALGVNPDAERPWVAPLRRAMWLWSVTWCAKWRVQSARPADAAAAGEDWSADLSEAALVAHVKDRVDHYLTAAIVQHACTQADRLAQALQA
jgi:hypothetical protein